MSRTAAELEQGEPHARLRTKRGDPNRHPGRVNQLCASSAPLIRLYLDPAEQLTTSKALDWLGALP
jgi:hypothetical protein